MVVKVKINDDNGNLLGEFEGNDTSTIVKMAEKVGIEIPVACGIGACFACSCKIIKGEEHIDIGQKSVPLVDLPVDENGKYTEVLTCIGGIKSDSIKDDNEYEIILQKMM